MDVQRNGDPTSQVQIVLSNERAQPRQGTPLLRRQAGGLAQVSSFESSSARQNAIVRRDSSGWPLSRKNAWIRSSPYRRTSHATSTRRPNSRTRGRMNEASRATSSRSYGTSQNSQRSNCGGRTRCTLALTNTVTSAASRPAGLRLSFSAARPQRIPARLPRREAAVSRYPFAALGRAARSFPRSNPPSESRAASAELPINDALRPNRALPRGRPTRDLVELLEQPG